MILDLPEESRTVVEQWAFPIEPLLSRRPTAGFVQELRIGERQARLASALVEPNLERERHREHGTEPFAGALRGRGSAVRLDELLDDRQAETQSAVAPARSRIAAPKSVE